MRIKALERLREDVRTVFSRDPAARSVPEVLFCYPGLHALWLHRVAHHLWSHRMWFPARLLSHFSRFLTGIEIHPGARIGRRFFIDHGAGVVIGETAEIGDDVMLYQGVVLGGTTMEKRKRHPTVGDGVVIGAGAIALGAVTIGPDARIGAGSVVTKPVPPGVTVVGVPARVVQERNLPAAGDADVEHPQDPLSEAVRLILTQRDALLEPVTEVEQEATLVRSAHAMRRKSRQPGDQYDRGDGI